nr:class II heat shock protein [Tanacetum cinerariifolium]
MALDGSDQDARYALSKLLQRGTVAEYESEFLMLIKRVTRISDSLLKSFYISRLKPALQCIILRSNPKTLDEAFSLARAAKTRFTNLDIWEFLRSNPSTLGEDFFKARVTEACFEIIAKEEKKHIVEKKIDVYLPLQGEFASPKAEGSLNADEYTGVEEVVDGGEALGIGEDNDLGDAATDTGGETLLYEYMCTHVAIEIQDLRRNVDLYMLLMNVETSITTNSNECSNSKTTMGSRNQDIFLDITLRTMSL